MCESLLSFFTAWSKNINNRSDWALYPLWAIGLGDRQYWI